MAETTTSNCSPGYERRDGGESVDTFYAIDARAAEFENLHGAKITANPLTFIV